MAIIELPKDKYSKRCQAHGLDVCPVKLTGISRLKARLSRSFGETVSLDELDTERECKDDPVSFARFPHRVE